MITQLVGVNFFDLRLICISYLQRSDSRTKSNTASLKTLEGEVAELVRIYLHLYDLSQERFKDSQKLTHWHLIDLSDVYQDPLVNLKPSSCCV